MEEHPELLKNALGPLNLPASAVRVTDADEEIFLLYTSLAALKPADSSDAGHFHGLGFENSHEDTISVCIELTPPARPRDQPRRRGKARRAAGADEPVVLEYELFQDRTALHSRRGDTGSVLWKASIEFLTLVLQQHRFPPEYTLFDYVGLSAAHVLELGCAPPGTGLLARALAPLVRRYTATDIPALVPLLRKNLVAVPGTAAAALDWTLPAARQLDVSTGPPDLVLVVDCIYHPTLVRPLLETLRALGAPALVVAELRAEDVLREFLAGWLADGWHMWSVGEGLLGPRWGMWIGYPDNRG
ncbi:hypothetical protein BC834DRAFT_834385 [Gloeopeniophorella convolvens]|nr:hypothetical protein BC834DRAFT_834385 [Gloeopeniophorella convolvens]